MGQESDNCLRRCRLVATERGDEARWICLGQVEGKEELFVVGRGEVLGGGNCLPEKMKGVPADCPVLRSRGRGRRGNRRGVNTGN
jgi:hypothetical protein